MAKKIDDYPDLRAMLHGILFNGMSYPFSPLNHETNLGAMFGYLKNKNGIIAISNRIFDMVLTNRFIVDSILSGDEFKVSSVNKNQFIMGNILNVDLIMQKFYQHSTEICGGNDEKFIEARGREIFLIYLKPIINGTGNYYMEARTRDQKRTDIIIDYHGTRTVIEMKIWHGKEYNARDKQQLFEYLDFYHLDKGYLLSFNFNKNKKTGIHEITYKGKLIVEVVV